MGSKGQRVTCSSTYMQVIGNYIDTEDENELSFYFQYLFTIEYK